MDVEVIISSVLITISLLLIQGHVLGGGVHQFPLSLDVPAGTSAELGCRYDQPATEARAAAFQWDLPSGRLYAVVPGARTGGRANGRVTLHADLRDRSSRLRIGSVSPADSGFYLCTVQLLEPLPIVQMKGGGTWLHVIQGDVRPGRNESEDVLLHPGDVRPGGNESEDVLLHSGDVRPERNESADVLLHPVTMDTRRSAMGPWIFTSLFCVVGVSLAGGIGYSCSMMRRHRKGGTKSGAVTPSVARGNASESQAETL